MSGTGGALEVLFDAGSITEFSDRLNFLDNVAQDDADLIAAAKVKAEELARERERLSELAETREAQTEELRGEARTIEEKISAMNARVAELVEKLKKERQAARQQQIVNEVLGQPSTPTGSGSIQVCPVAGPNSFVDSFGWPRSGGRTHQGIDLMAASGTPVVATHAGSARRNDNALGGISVIVTGAGGTWTYYAHLSGTATLGSVSPGTVIGYVGSTGNAGTPHLHFELHPGDGGAVNPYSMLRAVC